MDNSEDRLIKESRNLFDRLRHSDTLLVAVVPIMAYSIVFFYNLGYLLYFNLPITFISFKIQDVMISLVATLTIGYLIFSLGNILFVFADHVPYPIRYRLIQVIIIPIVLAFAYIAIYANSLKEIVIPLISLSIYMVLVGSAEFILPIFQYRNIKGYLNKLIAQDKKIIQDFEINKNIQTGTERIIRMLGIQPVIFLLFLFLAYHLGRSEAMGKDEFYILDTSPEKVILWMTDEYFICSPFDRDNQEVYERFSVIKVAEDPTLIFTKEYLGRLAVKPISELNISVPALLPTNPIPAIITVQPSPTPQSITTMESSAESPSPTSIP